jgi:hypothetical protein
MEKTYLKILAFFFFACYPFFVSAATLTIIPAGGTYEIGQKFTVRVIASSGVPFNAVSSSLLFSSPVFSVDSVSKAGSLLTFWVKEPVLSQSAGTISFEGVTPGGIKESSGMIATATLHGTRVGEGTVSFQSGQVLANDGEGTDITGSMTGAKFTIIEAKPKPVPVKQPAVAEPKIETKEEEPPQPAPSLDAPGIMLGEKYGAPAIIGTSEYPNTQTLITFTSSEGAKIFITGITDGDGTFTLLIPRSLKRGDYTVTARMIGEKGLSSKDGNAINITVGNWFSDLSAEIRWAILLLLLVLLYMIVRILLHIRKDREMRLTVKKEVTEAENAVHESLDALKEEIAEHLQEKTSITEHKRMTGINRDIGDVEKIIKKEIKDIEIK